jgi:hypothetical protein
MAWRFPGDLAAISIHCENVRVSVRIEDEDDSTIGVDRRGDYPMLTIEWSERQLPSRFALEIIRRQAEISEEDKNALSTDHGGRRGTVIERVLGFAPGSPD